MMLPETYANQVVGGLLPTFIARERNLTERIKASELDQDLLARAAFVKDRDAIAEISRQIVVRIENRRSLRRAGSTHLVRRQQTMSEEDQRLFAGAMLESCLHYALVPPTELIQLCIMLFGLDLPVKNRTPGAWLRTNALRYWAAHPNASLREVARAIKVSPTTISTLMKDPEFLQERDELAALVKSGTVDVG